jgi:superfamily II DNA or RNA helicase
MKAALCRRSFSILALPTGSGKTFVANEIVRDVVLSGGRVLWLALNWELLLQAASAYVRRFDSMGDLGRIGGSGSPLLGILPQSTQKSVLYTTLHTWYRRQEKADLSPGHINLLVVDECHWGIHGAMGRALLRRYQAQVPIFGLSATPRHVEVPPETEPARIGYAKTFVELKGTYLAEPRLETPMTNTNWRPRLLTTGDFSAASFRELAASEDRNELICRTLLEGIGSKRYSRVMVFACNVEHAECLASLFSKHGIDARALHYAVTNQAEKSALIEQFKAGAFNVIVNVAMLTHGVDIPDIDAVFLTRPTASEVLCSQMVGRGTRLIEGKKTHFWIVEFTDNLERHGDQVFRARNLLPVSVAQRLFRTRQPAPKFHHPPPEAPRFLRLTEPVEVAGLPYVEDQTFGVEIEFTSPLGTPDSTGIEYPSWSWQLVGTSILQAIESVATFPVDKQLRNYHEVEETQRWRVEFDRSAGWEVVSPILCNQEGFSELVNVLSALSALLRRSDNLHINHRTGLHVTLGSGFTQDSQVQGLVRLIQTLEPGLFTLVCPSRCYDFCNGHYCLRRNNKYCLPLRGLNMDVDQLGLSSFGGKSAAIRYRTVNLSHISRQDQHIEIRLHDGTTDYTTVVAWISLWMTIFNRARFHWPQTCGETKIFPGGNTRIDAAQAKAEDVFALLDGLDIHLDPLLRDTLSRRRLSLLQRWKKAIPQRVKSWRRCWGSQSTPLDATDVGILH